MALVAIPKSSNFGDAFKSNTSVQPKATSSNSRTSTSKGQIDTRFVSIKDIREAGVSNIREYAAKKRAEGYSVIDSTGSGSGVSTSKPLSSGTDVLEVRDKLGRVVQRGSTSRVRDVPSITGEGELYKINQATTEKYLGKPQPAVKPTSRYLVSEQNLLIGITTTKPYITQPEKQTIQVYSYDQKPQYEITRSEFVRAAQEGGQKIARGDILGGLGSLSYSGLTGLKASGELISYTAENLKSYTGFEEKSLFEYGGIDYKAWTGFELSTRRAESFVKTGSYFVLSGVSGFGKTFEFGAGLARDSPLLVGGAIAAVPVLSASFVKDPLGFGSGVIQKGFSGVSGFVGTLGTSIVEKPVSFSGEFAGGYLAFGVAGKGAGLIKEGALRVSSVGKTYIPREKLTLPEVISGKKTFPEAKSAQDALRKYNQETYKFATGREAVYSATDYPFTPFKGRDILISSGRGLSKSVDVPGVYTSLRGVSEYFLRMNKGSYAYKLFPTSIKEMLPKFPKILAISEKPFRVPSKYLTSLSKAQSYFGKKGLTFTQAKGVPGRPYISPALEFGLKKEAEAVIQVGSALKRTQLNTYWEKLTGFSKYTRINGKTIPIYEYDAVLTAGKVKTGLIGKVSASDYSNYSSGISRSYLVSPKTILPSYVASKKDYVSSYEKSSFGSSYSYTPYQKYSYVSSYEKPYVPSYVPSYTPSYSPSYSSSGSSYTPSYVPSYTPSYSPTYTPSYKPTYKTSYRSYGKYLPYASTYVPEKRDYTYLTSKLPKLKVKGKMKSKIRSYRPTNIANLVLPLKTDWLKALNFASYKPNVKTIGLLPSKVKGFKQVGKIIGVGF